MKIKTIGTGSFTGPSRSFCTLIDDKILVDCGNGIVKEMIKQNIDINNINYLLITHMHADHYFDIPFLIIQRDIIKSKNKLTIICPLGGKNMIRELTRLSFIDFYNTEEEYNSLLERTNTRIQEIGEVNNYILNKDYQISTFKVIHGKLDNCLAYIISNNNKKIAISGDSSYCSSIDKIINEVNISILDMSFEKGSIWHMGLDDIKQLLNKYHKTIIVSHLSSKVRESLNNIKIDNLIIPNDGDEFII